MSDVSQLGWVDFSNEDRDRVKHALKQLSEPGTLDELGIGPLRDGFADLMFPGFSTLQTRAKYFITVPRIIRDYLHLGLRKQQKQSLQDYLGEQETLLSERLRDKHRDDGQIGISGASLSAGERVSRHPSSIYWVGLRTWKLVDTSGSLRQFLEALGAQEESIGITQGDERDDSDAQSPASHIFLDRYIPDWLDAVDIRLTKSEAEFLSQKFKVGPAQSLPTQLERLTLRQNALSLGDASFAALAAWVAGQSRLHNRTRETVAMAQAFSELIYGAHLRFNIILVRKDRADHGTLLSDLTDRWQAWRKQPQASSADVSLWVNQTGISLAGHTKAFLQQWASGLANNVPDQELDHLVEYQARSNKKERSVLNKVLPEGVQWVGMARLDYRWWQVRTVLKDVQEGLHAESAY